MREELFTYDNLAVAVKADAADEIKTAYCTLGWRLEDEYGDDSYGDIIHMTLSVRTLSAARTGFSFFRCATRWRSILLRARTAGWAPAPRLSRRCL